MLIIHELIISEAGQGMTEYALILSCIVVGLIGALTAFRDAAEGVYDSLLGKLREASSANG